MADSIGHKIKNTIRSEMPTGGGIDKIDKIDKIIYSLAQGNITRL
jgi:hypothetical protein